VVLKYIQSLEAESRKCVGDRRTNNDPTKCDILDAKAVTTAPYVRMGVDCGLLAVLFGGGCHPLLPRKPLFSASVSLLLSLSPSFFVSRVQTKEQRKRRTRSINRTWNQPWCIGCGNTVLARHVCCHYPELSRHEDHTKGVAFQEGGDGCRESAVNGRIGNVCHIVGFITRIKQTRKQRKVTESKNETKPRDRDRQQQKVTEIKQTTGRDRHTPLKEKRSPHHQPTTVAYVYGDGDNATQWQPGNESGSEHEHRHGRQDSCECPMSHRPGRSERCEEWGLRMGRSQPARHHKLCICSASHIC